VTSSRSLRVDVLIDVIARNSGDATQADLWSHEIQEGIECVVNPKATSILLDARTEILAFRATMETEMHSPAT
jgi:hypothetical protein